MRFHPVDVDDEVFQHVKANAEPLVDNFNSALRRLLGLPSRRNTRSRRMTSTEMADGSNDSIPAMGKNTPAALRQILEVAYLVRKHGAGRTSATRKVARRNGVFPQTVQDKYCRQLGLAAREFDELLEQHDVGDLRRLLKAKFVDRVELIDRVLLDEPAGGSTGSGS